MLFTETIGYLHSFLPHTTSAINMSYRLLQHNNRITKCCLVGANSKSRVLLSLPFLEFFLVCLLFTHIKDYSFLSTVLLWFPSLWNALLWQTLNTDSHDKVLSVSISSMSLSKHIVFLRKMTSGKHLHRSLNYLPISWKSIRTLNPNKGLYKKVSEPMNDNKLNIYAWIIMRPQ